MRIFGVQYDVAWEDRAANCRKVESLLAAEDIPAGSLIVLPEMFASGFSMNVDRIHEESPSETEAFMARLAEQYQSCVLGGLVGRSSSGKGINKLSVYGPDQGLIGTYQKNHCFSFTGESDHYEPGSDILVFDWQGFTICPTICYDLRFPELYRRGVRAGANLFVVMASWPVDRIEHWDILARARAIENQATVVAVNRIGRDPKWTHSGHSQIIDHMGMVLARSVDEETCVSAEVPLKPLLDWRDRFRVLQDMKEQS